VTGVVAPDLPQAASRQLAGRWTFLVAFALVFYGNGAAFIESFVNYPSWHLIGADEFTQFHRFIGPRVLAFLVAPALLGTLFTILMLWFRPPAVPRWAVWAAIVLQLIVFVSTATIQLPIQFELSARGLSLPLIERLIETNFWLRRIPYGAAAALFLWMGSKTLQAAADSPVP
jgi:hypothetical protein